MSYQKKTDTVLKDLGQKAVESVNITNSSWAGVLDTGAIVMIVDPSTSDWRESQSGKSWIVESSWNSSQHRRGFVPISEDLGLVFTLTHRKENNGKKTAKTSSGTKKGTSKKSSSAKSKTGSSEASGQTEGSGSDNEINVDAEQVAEILRYLKANGKA